MRDRANLFVLFFFDNQVIVSHLLHSFSITTGEVTLAHEIKEKRHKKNMSNFEFYILVK